MDKNRLQKLMHSSVDTIVTAGFDGYVDSILRVRCPGDGFFSTLREFGEYIAGKSQKSCSLELHREAQKIGGNMPIFSHALSRLGVTVNCVGAMGYPEVVPLFKGLGESCRLFSVSNPGHCQALEFDDGKLMLADNEDIEQLDYGTMIHRCDREQLVSLFEKSQMIVLLNWSEMKGSLSLWRGLQKEIFPQLTPQKRSAFIDLSDCSTRSSQEILEAVKLIRSFGSCFDLSVSFNRNEAERVAEVGELVYDTVDDLAMQLYELLGCNRLIIHLVDGSYCVHQGHVHVQSNRHIEHPVLSTGGGDNFNAGFVYGLLRGLDCDECIAFAHGVSGYYVSHGHSPYPEELLSWMTDGQ